MTIGGWIEIDELMKIEPANDFQQEFKEFWKGIAAEADRMILDMAIEVYKSFSHGKRNRIKRGLRLQPEDLSTYRILKKAKELNMI